MLSLTRQVQQVVTPVGGGRLVHGAPDQGPGLASGIIINSQKMLKWPLFFLTHLEDIEIAVVDG